MTWLHCGNEKYFIMVCYLILFHLQTQFEAPTANLWKHQNELFLFLLQCFQLYSIMILSFIVWKISIVKRIVISSSLLNIVIKREIAISPFAIMFSKFVCFRDVKICLHLRWVNPFHIQQVCCRSIWIHLGKNMENRYKWKKNDWI